MRSRTGFLAAFARGPDRDGLLASEMERTPAPEQASLVRELFLKGGIGEQQAVLRALPLLPNPSQFLSTAVEACRTNVVSVFEAIACDNPYPAEHFPEINFNQMVLKALFLEVSLARIEGLAGRTTPELTRMARGYASEREAAGRAVPADIRRLTGEAAS